MHITIIGTGYVGLVTGACFSEMGNFVTCVDVDEKKVEGLKAGILPIYEPGLDEVVIQNQKQGRLKFTTSLLDAMQTSEVLFIAVGTPPGEDGSADLTYVLQVAAQIGKYIERRSIVVDKSTVPVGTADKVRAVIQQELDKRNLSVDFDVVSNPEFLKEGAAVRDFMTPDRIVIGADKDFSKEIMAELYSPFTRNHPRLVYMGVRDAEMTKYAANAMLATKISFMNEIAQLCELLKVDVEQVRLGIGSDSRIGFDFIYPGAGYGGSCFPKDVKALVGMSGAVGFDAVLLKAVEHRNDSQKTRLFEKIKAKYKSSLIGKKICVWGLSFKPGTDDMRAAPSTILINSLLADGASVRAYDPVAMKVATTEFDSSYFNSGQLTFVDDMYHCAENADALVLVTEWKQFRHPDFEKLKSMMVRPLIFDGRNQFDPNQLERSGFEYHGIGRELVNF